MNRLDHIMYATPDLQRGIDAIGDLTGVAPAPSGSHPGLGTRNALSSLGSDQYLEIIAPDPEQELQGTLGAQLVERGTSGIRGWAIATDDLEGARSIIIDNGLEPHPVVDMTRTTPDGVRLEWQLFLLQGAPSLPFFIDWKDSPHPARTAPSGCTLIEFSVSTPDAAAIRALMAALDVEITVVEGEAGFSARLQTPRGEVALTSG
jgi:hypothetical protein